MAEKLKLGLAALTLSAAALATSGCEVCSSVKRMQPMQPMQGCYQQSCPTGGYQQSPVQSECYAPAVCSPAAAVK